MLNKIIMDRIAAGGMDRELGEIVRDPAYIDYTAVEIIAVLTDRIADNMPPEPHCGLKWPLRVLVAGLVGLVVFAAAVGGG